MALLAKHIRWFKTLRDGFENEIYPHMDTHTNLQ